MDANNPATLIASEYKHICEIGEADSTTLLTLMAVALDTEFQKGLVSMKNVDITPPTDSLKFTAQSNPSDNARHIAEQVTSYWLQTITPTGIPQSCDSITGVSNDASKIKDPIESNLLSIYNGSILTPSFYHFCDAIIKEVKKITWVVNEASSKCATTFTVTIS